MGTGQAGEAGRVLVLLVGRAVGEEGEHLGDAGVVLGAVLGIDADPRMDGLAAAVHDGGHG